MKKLLKVLPGAGLAVVVADLAIAYFSLNALVKKGIETAGPAVCTG